MVGVRGGGGGDYGVVGVVNLVEMKVNFGEKKKDEEMGCVEIEEGGGVFVVDESGERSGGCGVAWCRPRGGGGDSLGGGGGRL